MHPFHFIAQRKPWFPAALVVPLLLLGAVSAGAQGPRLTSAGPSAPAATSAGTAFTYQGQLKNNGAPVTGTCDFKFDVFDAATGTGLIAGPLTQTAVQVNDGLFTTVLDFGGGVFTGDARWLHIAVACPSGGSYVPLGPRQQLTPAPVALSLPGLSTDQSGISPNVTIHGSDAALQVQSSGSSTYPRTIYTADTSEWHTGVGGSTVSNGVNNEYYVFDAGANKFRLVIDANGNVGVGTTSPGANVEVYSVDPLVNIRNSNDTGGGFVGNSHNALELGLYNPSGSWWGVIPPNTRQTLFGVDNSGKVGSLTNEFPGLSYRNVLDDGNGNAEISGTLMVNTVDAVTNIRNTNDTGGGFVGNSHNALELGMYNPTGSAWGVVPANTKETFLGIDNSGNVCTLAKSFPAALSFSNCRNVLDDGTGGEFIRGVLQVAGPAQFYKPTIVALGSAGSTSLCQNQLGEIATCSSSLRYKSNVADLRLGLETVMQLRPVTFDWKSNGDHDLGFVAEEVNAITPVLTTLNKDGQIEGVKYDRLTAVLVKGMQEQQQQIAAAQAQNETLQKQSGELETQVAAQQKQIDAIQSRLAALEQASPTSGARSNDWTYVLAFAAGAGAVVVIERARSHRR